MLQLLKRIILVISLLPNVGICFGSDKGIYEISHQSSLVAHDLYVTFHPPMLLECKPNIGIYLKRREIQGSCLPPIMSSPIQQLGQVFEHIVNEQTDVEKLKASAYEFWNWHKMGKSPQDLERLRYDIILVLYAKIKTFLLEKIKSADDQNKNRAILAAYYTYEAVELTADKISKSRARWLASWAADNAADKPVYSKVTRWRTAAHTTAKDAAHTTAKDAANDIKDKADNIYSVFTTNKKKTIDIWRGWQMVRIFMLVIMNQNMESEDKLHNTDPRKIYEYIFKKLLDNNVNVDNLTLNSYRSQIINENTPLRTAQVKTKVLYPYILHNDATHKEYYQKFLDFSPGILSTLLDIPPLTI